VKEVARPRSENALSASETLDHVVDVKGLVGAVPCPEGLDVVVVVEQQRLGIGGAGPAERVGEVALAEMLRPEALEVDGRWAVPRVAGRLVDDIPLPDLAPEVGHHIGDVVAQQAAQLFIADGAVGGT
jgi:hypothetical protein